MKSLLPLNATSFEKNLESIVSFTVNSEILKGFKFRKNPKILSHLVWEYGLNDVLNYIEGRNIIIDGIVFQRTLGTKSAITVSAKWANLSDIDVYEEEPSRHFYEFQIGVKNRQFDFNAELLKNIIDLAKPVRSKLSRLYNDTFDVRYFKLDGSQFGDLLSDNSGVKLCDLTL